MNGVEAIELANRAVAIKDTAKIERLSVPYLHLKYALSGNRLLIDSSTFDKFGLIVLSKLRSL